MGWIVHHTIVVTSWNDKEIEKAHKKAEEIFPRVSEITKTTTNGYQSFFIPPDGSKEGWEESDLGDKAREVFINWLNEQRYEDGSTALSWVEVQFGNECQPPKRVRIINDSSGVYSRL